MRTFWRGPVLMTVTCAAAVLGLAHCKAAPRHAPPTLLPEELDGGRLVFQDDFERADIGSAYVVDEGGDWRIEGGWLRSKNAENRGVWLREALPEKVRIEFRSRSRMPASGTFRGDMKCEVFATEPAHQKGYILIFGGWQNTVNTIARLDEHQADRIENNDRRVVADREYRWQIVRTAGTLHWYLDGKPFLRLDDPQPIQGRYFGFNNWQTDVEFDGLKVFAL